MPTHYVLKIKSSTKIPNFLQLRDKHFVLIGYVRLDKELSDLEKYGLHMHKEALIKYIEQLPFGKVGKFQTP